MAEKAFIKEFSFGLFETNMVIVATVDYCRTNQTIPVVINTETLDFDASPNQIQVALTAAAIERGTVLGFTLANSDVYILDLIKGVP